MLYANTAYTNAGFLAAAVTVRSQGATRVDINERTRRSRVIDSIHILANWYPWVRPRAVAAAMMVLALESVALADPLALAEPAPHQGLPFNHVLRDPAKSLNKDTRDFANMAIGQHRDLVSYPTGEAPGTIIIDTPHTYL